MPEIEVTFDKTLQRDLDRAIQKVQNPKAFLQAVQAEMLVDVKDHFEDQKGPTKGWKENSKFVKREKLAKTSKFSQGRGIKALINTGVLFKSVTQKRAPHSNNKIGSNLARIGTKLKYASINNFGGSVNIPEIKPKKGKALKIPVAGGFIFRKSAKAHTVKIPKREFMYLSKAFDKRIAKKLFEIITGALKI